MCWADAQGASSGSYQCGDWCRLPGYDALTAPPPFDPTSTLVSYTDVGNCGPRGNDAGAVLNQGDCYNCGAV